MVDLITAQHVAQRWLTEGGLLLGTCDTIVQNAGLRKALAAPTRNAYRNTPYEMVDMITARHVAHRWVTGGGPC